MKGLLLGLLASVSAASNHAPEVAAQSLRSSRQPALMVSDWRLSTQLSESCVAQATGTVTEADGASLSVQCTHDAVLGNVSASLAAQTWRHRRVTVTAEINAADALHASLWLKTQRGASTLMFDDDSEQDFISAAPLADGWVRRTITLPVAADATQISFGVLLSGAGNVELRQLQLTVSEPGLIAPEATQLLNAVISIVKQQTLLRTDLRWQVLEPQLRLFASGAQTSADAYPAAKYLLAMLGDRHSVLLTPEIAAAFQGKAAAEATDADAQINSFALPDGSRLVLSRAVGDGGIRTAQNVAKAAALP